MSLYQGGYLAIDGCGIIPCGIHQQCALLARWLLDEDLRLDGIHSSETCPSKVCNRVIS